MKEDDEGTQIPYLTYRGDASWRSSFMGEKGAGSLFIQFLGSGGVAGRTGGSNLQGGTRQGAARGKADTQHRGAWEREGAVLGKADARHRDAREREKGDGMAQAAGQDGTDPSGGARVQGEKGAMAAVALGAWKIGGRRAGAQKPGGEGREGA
jgi:hypothetical protein